MTAAASGEYPSVRGSRVVVGSHGREKKVTKPRRADDRNALLN